MKTQSIVGTLLILFFVDVSSSSAQWTQTNSFYGGYFTSFVVSGTNIFAGASGDGLFLSTNGGASWTKLGLDDGTWITSLAIAPNGTKGINLFVGATSGAVGELNGVIRSTDNGQTWTEVTSGLTNLNVTALATLADATGGTILFAATNGGGVFLSTNNGAGWVEADSGIGHPYVTALAVSGSSLFAAADYGGVFRSTNNGTSWTNVSSGLANTCVTALAFSSNGTNLFAGTDGGGVFLSTDNGTNWAAVSSGLTNLHILSLSGSGASVFAGTNGGGVFLSTNNGASWNPVNTGLDFPFVRSLLAVPNGGGTKILAGTWGAGIYLSTNNGSSWTSVNSGLVCRCVNALAACDSNLFVGTNGCAAFESTDGGASWGQINKGMDSPNVYALAVVPNGQGGTNILAGAGGIFLSTNSGANWVRLNSDNRSVMGDVHAFAMTGTESGTTKIFAGNNALDIHQVQVFVSGDNGHSWTQLGVNIDATRVNALAAFDVYVFVGTDNRGIFLSTDGGMHWVQRNNGLLDYSVNALTTSANDVGGMNIYAATSHGIFLSTDCGLNWRLTNTDQISTHAQSLAICRDRMFAAVSASVWQRPLSEIVSGLKGTGDNVPLRISLSQNYPNPFNPSTTIRFELPKDANVSLKVFNTLGQLIATFIDEPKRAGVYRVSWNASAVPSGSYFYRLSTGGIVETKKMIVVK